MAKRGAATTKSIREAMELARFFARGCGRRDRKMAGELVYAIRQSPYPPSHELRAFADELRKELDTGEDRE